MPLRQIFEGIYQIELAWGMAYLLIGGGRSAIIDTGLASDLPALRAAIAEAGVSGETVDAVYLTHGHCDHAGGAAWFAERGARIYAHRLEAHFIQPPAFSYGPRGWGCLRRPLTALGFWIGERRFPVRRCPVDVQLEEGVLIESPVGPLRVLHTPGHTLGHISLYRESDRLLFSGDAVLSIIPIRRVEALSLPIKFLSEDWPEARRSARRLAELGPASLLPGHGYAITERTELRLREWALRLN